MPFKPPRMTTHGCSALDQTSRNSDCGSARPTINDRGVIAGLAASNVSAVRVTALSSMMFWQNSCSHLNNITRLRGIDGCLDVGLISGT